MFSDVLGARAGSFTPTRKDRIVRSPKSEGPWELAMTPVVLQNDRVVHTRHAPRLRAAAAKERLRVVHDDAMGALEGHVGHLRLGLA